MEEEWTTTPLENFRAAQTAEDHGGSCSLLLLREQGAHGDVWVGAIAVARDLEQGKMLLALSSAASIVVPAAPSGNSASVQAELIDQEGESGTDLVHLCVIDEDFLAGGRVLLMNDPLGGAGQGGMVSLPSLQACHRLGTERERTHACTGRDGTG